MDRNLKRETDFIRDRETTRKEEKGKVLELLESAKSKLDEAWGRMEYEDGSFGHAYHALNGCIKEVQNA